MAMPVRRWKRSLVAAMAVMASPVQSGEPQQAGLDPPAGWAELVENLAALPERLLAKVPAESRDDPTVRQEVARLALAALASSALDALAGDGDHPVFLPQVNIVLNVAQPNADTTYRIARITRGGTYRLRGTRGNLRMSVIAEGGLLPTSAGSPPTAGTTPNPVHDLNVLSVDAEGRFDVLLGPARPQGYSGEFWTLRPATDRLLLRLVSADWGREREPALSIERVDHPVERRRRSATDLEQRLRGLPAAIGVLAESYVGAVTRLRAQGFVNILRRMDSAALALPGQMYYEGAYEIADDEALIVEARLPRRCQYRSIILTNDVYETIDWYDNQSSLNDTQANPDHDGILRVVISARDPGIANWLDTAGYARGSIQGRWTGCDSEPVPTVRKIAFADLTAALPAETPRLTAQERQTAIRERRAALQQRPLLYRGRGQERSSGAIGVTFRCGPSWSMPSHEALTSLRGRHAAAS